MRPLPWQRLWLSAFLWLRQRGALACFAALLLGVVAVCSGIIVPGIARDNLRMESQLQQLVTRHRPAGKTPETGDDAQLQSEAFTALLNEAQSMDEYVSSFYLVAGNVGLTIDQVDYDSTQSPKDGYRTVQVSLPMKGHYAALRDFCEQSLMLMPFAALDSVQLKRDAAAVDVLDGKLHFTLFLPAVRVASSPDRLMPARVRAAGGKAP